MCYHPSLPQLTTVPTAVALRANDLTAIILTILSIKGHVYVWSYLGCTLDLTFPMTFLTRQVQPGSCHLTRQRQHPQRAQWWWVMAIPDPSEPSPCSPLSPRMQCPGGLVLKALWEAGLSILKSSQTLIQQISLVSPDQLDKAQPVSLPQGFALTFAFWCQVGVQCGVPPLRDLAI